MTYFLKIPKFKLVRKNSFPAFKIALILFLSFSFSSAFAQNDKEVAAIVKEYDLKKLKELEQLFLKTAQIEKNKALKAAKINNWPVFIKNENGTVDELMKLTADGQPLYYSVDNVNASKSTRANFLNTGGALGLNLNGEGLTARVWDGGKVRASHQEFGGRVTVVDDTAGPSGNNFHSTHVTGTVIAAGVDPLAKGMAPVATARTFNWTNDISEALSEVQKGMLLSNHSYGVPIVNNGQFVSSWYIGAYSQDSRDWDEALYNSPYYLMVASAGNNGNDANPNPSTLNYDKLTGNKTSKNNLVVANANDANINAAGNLVNVSINTSSSQGPADDRRIKPDITGNGTNVYSTFETSDTAYGSISGTSMASPNVMGTLLLIQQHYKNINQRFMRASTLKALACHTADDAGKTGPDAIYGWGLLNAKRAVETINANGLGSIVSEEILQQGQSFTFDVTSNGTDPLQASIAWTDVPGVANNGVVNSTTPALVNDLDIRITKATDTYYPYRLVTPNVASVNNGDNNVDNIEKIVVPAATGIYTVTVTHKGTLQRGPQNYSLIVTGVSSAFGLTVTSTDQTACTTGNAVYNFNHAQSAAGTTTFTAVGLPTGATATFNRPTISENGVVSMTVSNLQGVTPGDYIVGIKGVRGTETEIKNVNLKVYSSTFATVSLVSPANNSTAVATSLNLNWDAVANTESYKVQVATDVAMTNLIVNQTTTESEYIVTGISEGTDYYWRILPVNRCAEATTGTVYKFKTGYLSCGNTFTATNFSDGLIGLGANASASATVTVTGGMTVGNVTATINISHSYIEDFVVYLMGPEGMNYPMIKLIDHACGDYQDIATTISDAGLTITCNINAPAISGTIKPAESLTRFNNLPADGDWTLIVRDSYEGDGGNITGFSLNICNVTATSLGVSDNELLKVSVYPNPSKGIVNISLPEITEKTTLNLHDIQGRVVLSKETSSTSEVLNIENLSDGVYLLSIESGNLKTTKKIILNR